MENNKEVRFSNQSQDHPIVTYDTEATCRQLIQRAQLVQGVLQSIMKEGVHFGKIPGTDGLTLLKPGAEKLMSAFQIAPQIEVVDLSDREVHYRVIVTGVQMRSGVAIGQGVGECSSREEKYAWRKALNQAEYQQFQAKGVPFAREKWRRGYNGRPDYVELQVRTDPIDRANTILKMAKKRALSDFCLTVLAASDIFDTQDLDAVPVETSQPTQQQPAKQPRQQNQPAPQSSQDLLRGNQPLTPKMISYEQKQQIQNACDTACISIDEIVEAMNLDALEKLEADRFEQAMGWIRANDDFGVSPKSPTVP